MFLAALDQTIVVTILPNLQRLFETNDINWIVTGYMLPVAIFSLIWGRLAFVYGTKRATMVSIIVFETGSLISALAQSFQTLIVGRVIAGVGGSGIATLCYLIINEISSVKYRSWFINIINLSFAVSSVIGPVLGGVFSEKVSWRWCFYINLPIGGFSFIVLVLVYKPHDTKGARDHVSGVASYYKILDINGLLTIATGLTLFLLGLSMGGNTYKWKSAIVICFIVIGFTLILLFLMVEYSYKETESHHPFIPFRILNYQFLHALSFLFIAEMCFIMQCIYLSDYLQYVQRNSELMSGIKLLPMIISVTVVSTSSSYVVSKYGILKPIAVLGAITSPLASYLLATLSEQSRLYQQLTTQILSGISFGFILIPGMMIPQIGQKDDDLNIATSLSAFIRAVGSSFGSVLGQLIFSNYIQERSDGLNLDYVLHDSQYGNDLDSPKLVVSGYRAVLYCAIGVGVVEFINSLFVNDRNINSGHTDTTTPPEDEEG
ncbi:hypothetical protein CANARDRAFT_194203 [[Candida] arabinofermentans NRRL YB-2248]|uniref:Major facilitator superfamily (MFS) profile domain-containing protein n=1 Tax=[Candida] arabinofermentans NRRL YB-2248 TaxID=983967 RepID=A0A1E4T6T2_9ASCO|nr:hypothetical protein CANARDRAFT_194203 [[Candida] arabinofermentans NRRL YB-2248]